MMNICVIADNNYVEYLATLIVSILKNSDVSDGFFFHVIEEDISDENKNKLLLLKQIKDFEIKFYKPINVEKYKTWVEQLRIINPSHLWSYKIFIKLDIPFIFQSLDNILYLDIDQIVLSRIDKYFKFDMSNYYLMAMQISKNSFDTGLDWIDSDEDYKRFTSYIYIYIYIYMNPKKDYLVSNIMMFNLNLIRQEKSLYEIEQNMDKCFEKYKKVIYSEEHILLFLFYSKMVFVDWSINKTLNHPEFDKNIEDREIKIYHYWGPKKYLSDRYLEYGYKNNFDKYYYIFWEYFSYTPFFIDNAIKYMKIFATHFVNDAINNLKTKNNMNKFCLFGIENDKKYLSFIIFGIKITFKKFK